MSDKIDKAEINARLDALVARIRASNTYRGRMTNNGEERCAIVEHIRELLLADTANAADK